METLILQITFSLLAVFPPITALTVYMFGYKEPFRKYVPYLFMTMFFILILGYSVIAISIVQCWLCK